MKDEDRRPYFLWDEEKTIREIKQALSHGSHEERVRLIAKIMREARDDEVWYFVTLEEILDLWDQIRPKLGNRRGFWEFLIDAWRDQKAV